MKFTNKYLKPMALAAFVMAATVSTGYADVPDVQVGKLSAEMFKIFKILRSLAFIGAAFILAGKAWGWIKAGKVEWENEMKGSGMAMIVGFFVLFSIGMIIGLFIPEGGNVVSAWK